MTPDQSAELKTAALQEKLQLLLEANETYQQLPEIVQFTVSGLVNTLAEKSWDEWDSHPQWDFVETLLISLLELPSTEEEVLAAELPTTKPAETRSSVGSLSDLTEIHLLSLYGNGVMWWLRESSPDGLKSVPEGFDTFLKTIELLHPEAKVTLFLLDTWAKTHESDEFGLDDMEEEEILRQQLTADPTWYQQFPSRVLKEATAEPRLKKIPFSDLRMQILDAIFEMAPSQQEYMMQEGSPLYHLVDEDDWTQWPEREIGKVCRDFLNGKLVMMELSQK